MRILPLALAIGLALTCSGCMEHVEVVLSKHVGMETENTPQAKSATPPDVLQVADETKFYTSKKNSDGTSTQELKSHKNDVLISLDAYRAILAEIDRLHALEPKK